MTYYNEKIMESFFAAIETGNTVRTLELMGQYPGIQNHSFQNLTALHLVADQSSREGDKGSREIAPILIVNKKSNLEVPDIGGMTPLHYAASSGNYEIAELLIRRNANVNAQALHGSTPLGIAKHFQQHAVIQLLKDNGALDSQEMMKAQKDHTLPEKSKRAERPSRTKPVAATQNPDPLSENIDTPGRGYY